MPTPTAHAVPAKPPVRPPGMGPPAIEVRGLGVRYGGQTVVSDLSLTVARGEVYALLGRNGSGKSSLVRTLLGLQAAAAGSVRLLGRDPWREREAVMSDVGYVPEEPHSPPEMSARALAAFCGRVRRSWDGAAVEERLSRLGVPLDRPFRRLSKGQKKQVELSLALGHHPPLVVLDDPTLGLDPLARRGFFGELMAELAEGGTSVVLATHDLAAVEGVAERVGVLAGGRLLVDEPLEGLKGRFRRLLLAGGDEDAVAALRPLSRSVRPWGVEVVVASWVEEASEAPGAVRTMSLEEIFAALHPSAGEQP